MSQSVEMQRFGEDATHLNFPHHTQEQMKKDAYFDLAFNITTVAVCIILAAALAYISYRFLIGKIIRDYKIGYLPLSGAICCSGFSILTTLAGMGFILWFAGGSICQAQRNFSQYLRKQKALELPK